MFFWRQQRQSLQLSPRGTTQGLGETLREGEKKLSSVKEENNVCIHVLHMYVSMYISVCMCENQTTYHFTSLYTYSGRSKGKEGCF